jgi:hypothetical protein
MTRGEWIFITLGFACAGWALLIQAAAHLVGQLAALLAAVY